MNYESMEFFRRAVVGARRVVAAPAGEIKTYAAHGLVQALPMIVVRSRFSMMRFRLHDGNDHGISGQRHEMIWRASPPGDRNQFHAAV